MSYQIITDSCCDFNQEQYAQHQLSCAPLTLTLEEVTYHNFTEPQQIQEFYGKLHQGVTATTAAVNPEDWKLQMEPLLQKGQDLLVLCFSGALSTTYQSAVIAAQELRESYPMQQIHVCDTLCAALGQGFLVHHACIHRKAGMDFAQLCRWVEENKLRVSHWFTVDDLNHLRRGGRISSTTAIVGTMLHVKPVLHLDEEGYLKNIAKVRGRKAALHYMAQKAAETAEDLSLAFIGHGDCPEDAALLESLLREQGFQNVQTGYVGPVIGAHTGPGVLALFFWGKER